MKKTILSIAAVLLAFAGFTQSEEDMAAMMAAATPGEMHHMLARYNGHWKAETKFWMMPGSEPMTSTAEVTTDMYMDDHYSKSMYNGEMGGMPFHGESTTGYDNVRKIFINTWIDNMGTGIMYSEGKWNEQNKSIEYKGQMSDPMSNGLVSFRQVVTYTDNNNYKMEMYNTMNGKEFKSMEVIFTRM